MASCVTENLGAVFSKLKSNIPFTHHQHFLWTDAACAPPPLSLPVLPLWESGGAAREPSWDLRPARARKQALGGPPVATETGSSPLGAAILGRRRAQWAAAPWRTRGARAGGRTAAQLIHGHGGARSPPGAAAAADRGLGPDAGPRLRGGAAAGQRGREAHRGPEQPLGQGDGRGGPGVHGRQLLAPRRLLPSGSGARAGGPAGVPRRAGERGPGTRAGREDWRPSPPRTRQPRPAARAAGPGACGGAARWCGRSADSPGSWAPSSAIANGTGPLLPSLESFETAVNITHFLRLRTDASKNFLFLKVSLKTRASNTVQKGKVQFSPSRRPVLILTVKQ